jgi:hypothetical protein
MSFFLDRREAIATMFTDTLGEARVERRELEVGPVLLDKLRQVGHAEENRASRT